MSVLVYFDGNNYPLGCSAQSANLLQTGAPGVYMVYTASTAGTTTSNAIYVDPKNNGLTATIQLYIYWVKLSNAIVIPSPTP